jgi:hypothetical protein
MQIVLDSLTEVPILNHAATKAGIHRKTLEYWLRRSAAGDAGYDIEWQGIEWRFHEHRTSAIDEADDSLRAVMWQIAMGVVSKTDENGNFIVEACGQPNMKMRGISWSGSVRRSGASVGRDTFRITLACLSSVVT